jgi:hypothetical protein
MSLMYRAIWQDDRPKLLEDAFERFAIWANAKHGALTVPKEGKSESPGVDVEVIRGESPDAEALRCALHEEVEANGDRWTTTLTAISALRPEPTQHLWVDVEWVSEDSFRPVSRVAPRLVGELLRSSGGTGRRGPVKLMDTPVAYSPTQVEQFLVPQLTHRERDVPIVVISEDIRDDQTVTRRRAEEAAKILAGTASVVILPERCVNPLMKVVGRERSVWGGALRIYLPGFDLDDSPSRHTVIELGRLTRTFRTAGQLASQRLAPFVTARRAPDCYESVRHLIRPNASELERELAATQATAEQWEQRYLDALADHEDALRQIDEQERIIGRLRANGPAKVPSEPATDKTPAPLTCAEAIELATGLKRVALHPDAPREIETMDEEIEASNWAQVMWRGLRALDQYATEASEYNGFWHWCEQSGRSLWPANDKKLAMSESEAVMRGGLAKYRTLPVTTAVRPDGRVVMQAHLKIASGGGPNIPRVYFYDDTKGRTRKVHVGFIGPHRLMPNTKTN